MRSDLGASDRLCWSGGILLSLASSQVFLMLVSHDFIIMMILLLFRWRADVRRVERCGVHGFGCVDYNAVNIGE